MARRVVPIAIVIVVIAAVVGVLVVALTAPSGIAAIDLVPQDANFVAEVQINKILADEDVVEAYNEVEKPPEWPETFAAALGWVEDETGIDPTDFSEALIFGDTESEDYFGAIVKGTFVEAELIDAIEAATGETMSTTPYNDYEIYTITVEDGAAICFLSDDIIVVGRRDVVEDVIDVKDGAPHLSGPVYDTYNSLGDVWIKGALEVPEGAMGGMPELEAFEDLEAVGFGFNKAGENLSLQIKLYFSDAESAADAEETISGIIALIPSVMPDMPGEVIDILEGMEVSVSDSWVTISLTATMDQIEALMEAMEEGEL